MKTKTKNTLKAKAKKRSASASRKKVSLVHAKRLGLHHFRLISHKHTFKLIHHRHTSHLSLFMILIVIGFFMYASGSMVKAETSSGTVLVGSIVPGPPPEFGATITTPIDGTTFKDQNIIDVSGTCSSDSFVIIKSNDIVVGSATCTSEGLFDLQIQLTIEKNILSALNYDNLNQAGPATPTVTVYATKTPEPVDVDPTKPVDVTPSTPSTPVKVFTPLIPDNPSIITGVNSHFLSCNDYKPGKLPIGGGLRVAIVCVPRLFFPKMEQIMGVVVWGGTPPYALSIDFGDGDDSDHPNSLLSLATPGYTKVKFSYAVPNTYRIKFRLTDNKNETAIVQTAVQVNGEVDSPISAIAKEIFGGKPWYESPVPFYLLAIAITLGFWGGDIFDRKYGASKYRGRARRTA